MKNILFVCTGNSCRSVMAEGFFKKLTEDRTQDFIVGSAGISAVEGFVATDETIRVMKEEGVDVSGHQSRRLSYEMVRKADKIFVMEEMHRDMILRLVPEAEPKVLLLTEFSSDHQEGEGRRDIPDPIRMSDNFYMNVAQFIRDCVENVIKSLREDEK